MVAGGTPGRGRGAEAAELSPNGAGRGGSGSFGGGVTISGGPGAAGSVTEGPVGSGSVTEGGVGSATTGWSAGPGSPGIMLCRGVTAACAVTAGAADGGMEPALEASGAGVLSAVVTLEAGGAFRSVEAATTMPAPVTSNRLLFSRRLPAPGWGGAGAGDPIPSTTAGDSVGWGGGLPSVKSSPQASQVTAKPAMETGTW